MTQRKINRLHIRLCVISFITPLAGTLSALLSLCGIAVIGLRINQCDPYPAGVALGCLLAPAMLLTVILFRKRLPTREQVRSLVDERGRHGGLILAEGIRGSEYWRPRAEKPVPNATWSNPPVLIALSGSLVFLLFSAWLPIPAIPKEPGSLQIGAALNRIEEQIDTLESLEMLEEERAELFRKELEAIEQEKNAENPAVTWEAIDQLAESINTKVNEELESLENRLAEQAAMNEIVDAVTEMWDEAQTGRDIAAMAATELAELLSSNAFTPELNSFMRQAVPGLCGSNSLAAAALSREDLKKLSDALNSLSAEEMSRLRELLESGLTDAARMQSCENARILTAEELRELLRSQSSKCSGGSCSNLTACVATVSTPGIRQSGTSGGKPGRGGVSRGPGSAPLAFSGNTAEEDFLFRLQALPKGSPQFRQNKLVGISAAAPQVTTDDAAASSGGVLTTGGARGAASVSTDLLPQHRKVVQNYFSREKPSIAKPKE